MTDTATEPAAADLITAVMPFLTDAVSQLFGAIGQTAALVQTVLDSRITCLPCAAEHHKAVAAGTPEAGLPPLNTANVIADGKGLCYAHLQFTDRPVMPGQTVSGLYVAGTR